MNGLMGLGVIGWLLSVAGGFVVGGLFFLSIKMQVEYVVRKQGPAWVLPAAMYARLVLLGVVLVVIAVTVPGERVAGVALGGVIGILIARILVSRMVRKGDQADGPEKQDFE